MNAKYHWMDGLNCRVDWPAGLFPRIIYMQCYRFLEWSSISSTASMTSRQIMLVLCLLSLRHHTSSCRLHCFIAGHTSIDPLSIYRRS